MTKKILLITARSDVGGGPKHVYDLLQFLRDKNVALSLASPEDPPYAGPFKELSSDHLTIPARAFSFVAFFKLLFFVKRHAVEVVHSHGRGAGLYSRLLYFFGVTVIHTYHGVHQENSPLGKMKLSLDRLLVNAVDRYICVSLSEKEKAIDLGVGKESNITVIKNGIDISGISQEFSRKKKKEEREKFGLPLDKVLVGTLSRLDAQKGHFDFLGALEEQTLSEKFHFVIAGGGECYEELNKTIKEKNLSNVTLLGETDLPVSFLSTLDVYFSYSRGEGLPLSVLEAMACGLPILLSDVAGHRDLAEGAYLFDPQKPEDFVAGLEELSSKSENWAAKALEKVSKDHSLESMVDATMKLYQK